VTNLLLCLHVLAAVLAIGPVAVAASMFPKALRRAHSDPGDREALAILRVLHRIGRVYAAIGIAVPVLGLATASSLGVLGSGWLIASILLTAAAAAILALLILPGQDSALAVAQAPRWRGSTGTPSSPPSTAATCQPPAGRSAPRASRPASPSATPSAWESKTLHVGMVQDVTASPERFFCASERMAVIPIPSLTSHEAFDCGIALGADAALRLLDHGRQAYAAARKVEMPEDVARLDVLREGSRRP
jgi:hypothetical protein